MAITLPDKLVREPNLLIPGRKPTGPVEIDWSHPLTNGLRTCHIFQSTRDLVDNVNGALLVSAKIERNLLNSAGTANSGMYTGTLSKHSGEITILAQIKPSSVSGVQQIYAADDSAPPMIRSWQFRLNAANVEVITFAGAVRATAGATTLLVDNWATVGASHSSGGADIVYLNGVIDNTGTNTGALATDLNCPHGIGARPQDSTELREPYGGDIAYVYQWDIVLSSAQVADLTRNPYQFLKPKGGAW